MHPAHESTMPHSIDSDLPLTGCRVLDLTIARAGPVAVRLLADWGADVVRIDPPDRKPTLGPRRGSDEQNLHRNKRSLSVNLKTPEGMRVLRQLVERSDVVVENFRASVKERLGLSYEALRAINPRIILASISGFGQTGPYAGRPGLDQIVQGMSGLSSVTGEPGRGPYRTGIAISDTTSGMFLGQGILLALLHRQRTGRGQWVHTSLLEAMLNKLDFQGARYTVEGRCRGRRAIRIPRWCRWARSMPATERSTSAGLAPRCGPGCARCSAPRIWRRTSATRTSPRVSRTGASSKRPSAPSRAASACANWWSG